MPPLNRFTVEEAEESGSNVTAEKKTAQTDRETPFWRIKSVKWLWESGGKLDVSAGLKSSQENASVSPAKAESFFFLFALLVEL